MPGRRPLALGAAGALVVVALAAHANAQENGAGGQGGAAAAAPASPAAAPAPASNPDAGTAPVAPDAGTTTPAPETTIPALPPAVAAPPPVEPPPPPPPPPPRVRGKPLRTSVGLSPTAADLGSEADIVSSADMAGTGTTLMSAPEQKFAFSMKGYLRAPMRLGWGPSVNHPMGSSVTELHSPPRIVGLGSGDWNYIALAPNPTGSLYLTAGVPNVTANVIFATGTFYDTGYKDLDQMGGISQAYVTLKFPALFGDRGGVAWTMGSFSNRYGNAGPYQTSSGYYGTYLFGRTHVAGEDLTADIDLTEHLELVIEHGIGAKIEVPPFITPTNPALPKNNFIPGQGNVPQGSDFLHHAHVGLMYDDWAKLGLHYLTSWSPLDGNPPTTTPGTPTEARLTVIGGDLHLDRDLWGNFYVGYSHINGSNLGALSDAIQVIHGSNGKGFKEDYFGPKDRTKYTYTNDTGTVDTVLWQYLFRLAPALGYAGRGRDIALTVYGMFNHVRSPSLLGQPGHGLDRDVNQNKLKFGAELEVLAMKLLSAGLRIDRVNPDTSNTSASYTALSPRLIFHTNWRSKEYVIVNYTHFWTGPTAYPGSPYSDAPYFTPDKDMLMVSAIMSL
jgi:hypothetical protein